MKRDNENDDSAANDTNNLSTSPPQKKQCLVIPSKPDNEGPHGSELDLVDGTIGASSKDVTAQKQGAGETEKQLLEETRSEETYSDSESDNEKDGHGSKPDTMTEEEIDYNSYADDRTVLDTFVEDISFNGYGMQTILYGGNREICLICLKKKIDSKEECLDYLKKIGVQDGESHFLGGSRSSNRWFYANLTDDEAAKLAREEGVYGVEPDFVF